MPRRLHKLIVTAGSKKCEQQKRILREALQYQADHDYLHDYIKKRSMMPAIPRSHGRPKPFITGLSPTSRECKFPSRSRRIDRSDFAPDLSVPKNAKLPVVGSYIHALRKVKVSRAVASEESSGSDIIEDLPSIIQRVSQAERRARSLSWDRGSAEYSSTDTDIDFIISN